MNVATSPCSSPIKKRLATPDRFIPMRESRDQRHYLLNTPTEEAGHLSPSQKVFNESLAKSVLSTVPSSNNILSFQSPVNKRKMESFEQTLKQLHRSRSISSTNMPHRTLPAGPDTILDAPDIVDDYYLNLLDWSSDNVLAIALGSAVYLWNGDTKETSVLVDYEDVIITSLAWDKGSRFLSVGTNDAVVHIYDVLASKRVRTLDGHNARVCSLSWNDHILSSGSRDSTIINHDVRVRNHHSSDFNGHTQEVCGLKWSPQGNLLASGGNDNLLNIWDIRSTTAPRHTSNQHVAAVKALAWCPWQANLLASGGGTADRTLRFWNASTGVCVNSVSTGSQVCSILWSKDYKELISSHGYSENQLILWKYPTLTKVAEFKSHQSRVLHMAMSPDGTTVCSAAGDETLRFWKIFDKAPASKPSLHMPSARRALFDSCIR
eukprot:TRINITY_DN2776_c0_g3_i1.p1 TRINITY_DN2776_c0_g3~~TRINITY_DN2776_c0_g3_i1.p1  ORF type:complete len:460 (-),score=98.94 TRINITY_DN2776_c0_g3_i1:217-1521(-)